MIKIINVIVVMELRGRIKVYSYSPFTSTPFYLIDEFSVNVDKTFPDKLQDLNGYKFKVFYFKDKPRLIEHRGCVYGPEVVLMEIVAKKLNASMELKVIPDGLKWRRNVKLVLRRDKADVILNTGMDIKQLDSKKLKYVKTFDTDGYCALVPHPKIHSHFDFIATPFDLWTWLLTFTSMTFCGILWHFSNKLLPVISPLRGLSYSSYFFFGFISNFLGQGFSFRPRGYVQKLILRLTFTLTFVLGNIYESLIIAAITQATHSHKITTINELISGNYSYNACKMFATQFNGSRFYHLMSHKISHFKALELNYKKLASENIVLIEPCAKIDALLSSLEVNESFEESASQFYYKLDEHFNSYFLEFPTALETVFFDRLNEISLRVFESGINHAPSAFTDTKRQIKVLNEKNRGENQLLNFDDINPIFKLLSIGLMLSAFVFSVEIFWHHLKVLFKRHLNFYRRYQTYRIIKVHPIN